MYTVYIICNNIYIGHSELIKIWRSCPQRILGCNFTMDFKLSASLECFAVTGFHLPTVKPDAEDDLPLNSTLPSLLSHASQALSLGSHTHPKANAEWSPWGPNLQGYRKPKSVHITVPYQGQRGDSACNVTAACGA